MRPLIYTVTSCFIAFILLSFSGERHRPSNINYWVLYTNEKELASMGDEDNGNGAKTISFSAKELATNETVWFFYQQCARSDKKRFTQMFLETPTGRSLLISSENSVDRYTGKFTMSQLNQTAKRLRIDSMVLVAKLEPGWSERLVKIKLDP
jgi:hypothetical protein